MRSFKLQALMLIVALSYTAIAIPPIRDLTRPRLNLAYRSNGPRFGPGRNDDDDKPGRGGRWHGSKELGRYRERPDNNGAKGQGIDLATHPWIPAEEVRDASRSPCPMMNTLANHGFLPRNGRNISMVAFDEAMISALNLDPLFAKQLTVNGFKLLGLIKDENSRTSQTIDLETLNNFTTGNDHDASLVRLDLIQSKELTRASTPLGTKIPNPSLIAALLRDTPGPFITTKSLGLTRLRRDRESAALSSPPLRADDKIAAFREAGLVVQFVGEGGDPNESGGGPEVWDQRRAKKSRVGEWLRHERFPKGWKKTTHPITAIGDMLPLADRVKFWQGEWEKGVVGDEQELEDHGSNDDD